MCSLYKKSYFFAWNLIGQFWPLDCNPCLNICYKMRGTLNLFHHFTWNFFLTSYFFSSVYSIIHPRTHRKMNIEQKSKNGENLTSFLDGLYSDLKIKDWRVPKVEVLGILFLPKKDFPALRFIDIYPVIRTLNSCFELPSP